MFLIQGFFWKVVGAFRTKVNFDGFVESKPEEKDDHIIVDGIAFPKEQITMLTEVQISGVKPLDLYKVMGVAVRTPIKEAIQGMPYSQEFAEIRKRINAIITVERSARRVIDRDEVMKLVDDTIEFGRAVLASEVRAGNYSLAKQSGETTLNKLNAIIVDIYDAPTKAQAAQGYRSYSEALLGRSSRVA